jgi:hypothetical protein
MDFQDFQTRLAAWSQLRHRCLDLPVEQCLSTVNSWWLSYPWIAYTLHWGDRHKWPDPWQLLEESRLCNLARGLGILYTIAMLERSDIQQVQLVETDRDNLVLVQEKKYILNWALDSIVNINPGIAKNSRHQFTLVEAQQQIR